MNNLRLVKESTGKNTYVYSLMRKDHHVASFKCAHKPLPAYDDNNLIYCFNGKVYHRRLGCDIIKAVDIGLRYTHHNAVQISIPAINVFTVWVGNVKHRYTLNFKGGISTVHESIDTTM